MNLSKTAATLIAFLAFAVGCVVGGAVVGSSKYSKAAEAAVEFKEEIDQLKATYGNKVHEVFTLMLDKKVVEILKNVDSETLGNELTVQGKEVVQEAGKTAKQALEEIRERMKKKGKQ